MAQLLSAVSLYSRLEYFRAKSPLVHNITNLVAMNFTANVLLASGASPIMAHAPEELSELIAIADSLVLNIGTLDETWIESMEKALEIAAKRAVPVVLDPVGAGATSLRTETAKKLLKSGAITVLRGNASEILALTNRVHSVTKGVDSQHASQDALEAAKQLSEDYQITVCVSGEVDLVVQGKALVALHNGHPLMTKVTAMGCAASAMIGAFLGIESDVFLATQSAMSVVGIAGQIAAEGNPGPGTFQIQFLDALSSLGQKEISRLLKVTEV